MNCKSLLDRAGGGRTAASSQSGRDRAAHDLLGFSLSSHLHSEENAGFEWRQVAAIVTAQSLNQANDPPFEPGYALVGRGDRDSGSNGKWPREKLV